MVRAPLCVGAELDVRRLQGLGLAMLLMATLAVLPANLKVIRVVTGPVDLVTVTGVLLMAMPAAVGAYVMAGVSAWCCASGSFSGFAGSLCCGADMAVDCCCPCTV